MNFEDTIVSEISQSQKTKNCMIAHLYKVLRIIKFIEIETIMVVPRDWEERRIWELFYGYWVSVLQYEKNCGDLLYNNVNVLNTNELYT